MPQILWMTSVSFHCESIVGPRLPSEQPSFDHAVSEVEHVSDDSQQENSGPHVRDGECLLRDDHEVTDSCSGDIHFAADHDDDTDRETGTDTDCYLRHRSGEEYLRHQEGCTDPVAARHQS